MAGPVEVDEIEIRVLINDQLDNIAPSWNPEVEARGRFSHIPPAILDDQQSEARGGAKVELDFNGGCCGAHGLSLMIVRGIAPSLHQLQLLIPADRGQRSKEAHHLIRCWTRWRDLERER